MSIRSVVIREIERVAQQQRKELAPLSDDLPLLDSGLDSLCIAIIVAGLDDELGVDPLFDGDNTTLPVTIGDFVLLYENATV